MRAAIPGGDWRTDVRTARNALHETAHAVLALVADMVIEAVNVDGDLSCKASGGSQASELDACYVLAGIAAEQHADGVRTYTPDELLRFCIDSARGTCPSNCDQCQAVARLIRLRPAAPDDEIAARFREFLAETIRFVGRQPIRDAIRRVADALIARGHLSGAEVEALAGPMLNQRRST